MIGRQRFTYLPSTVSVKHVEHVERAKRAHCSVEKGLNTWDVLTVW